MEPTVFEMLFALVTFPLQFIDTLVTSLLNVLVFDLLQLGPYLPLG